MALRLSGRFKVSRAMLSLSCRTRVVKFIEFVSRVNRLQSSATSSAHYPEACGSGSPRRSLSKSPIQFPLEDFPPARPEQTGILQDRQERNRNGGNRNCTRPLFFLSLAWDGYVGARRPRGV